MTDYTLLIVIIIIAVLVFLALREFWAWYFKVNHILESLKKSNQLLETLIRAVDSISIPNINEKNEEAIIRISGNETDSYILLAAIEESGQHADLAEKPNNQAEILFKTIKHARNSLQEAYGRLCVAEPDLIGIKNGISIFDDTIYYKQSKAEITKLV